jgi:NAD(P)-dependent dehydrogenase (short-subunit alcohol dehydrogenase family)
MKEYGLIRFAEEDLALFSASSGDHNPLHLSREYATRTSYGAQVVFGALGAVVALGVVPESDSRSILSLQADFLRPMFLGVDYSIQLSAQDDGLLVRVFDGTSAVVALTLKRGAARPDTDPGQGPAEGLFPRTDAVSLDEAAIVPGVSVAGTYGANPYARRELCRRWNVNVPPLLVDILLWGSYLVGMELPGKSALFSRFTAELGEPVGPGPFDYEASVEHVDRRLGQIRVRGRLSRGERSVASVECRSFLRPAAPSLDPAAIAAELPPSDTLGGKVALVIGSSRGLGAALAHALASQGATVIAASRSGTQEQLRNGALPGRLVPVQGDAGDARWQASLRAKILAEHGRLDLLVSNAFPSLLPLMIEENTRARIEDYMTRATAMTVGPLCSLLDLLTASRGSAVLISSIAVERPVKEWPHYVAAKRAAEALMEVAALQHPQVGVLVVRPERLLTEMTNTPLGRRNAIAPEHMAARIVQRIAEGISGWQLMR